MRARGASATDIVVLVVAADDGVMPQTVESIQHARRADVPIIVAVNKCDKPQADAQRVTRELLEHDVVCEELGGDVQAIHVSALKVTARGRPGDNLLALAEATVALAELLELKAEPSGAVEGLIIESRTDKGRGPVTSVIVQRGTLRRGCVLVAGTSWAKVRFLFDENGRAVPEAGPSAAVQVRAREVVEWRSYVEEQEKLQEEQSAIELKQALHLDEYRAERAGLTHLSWRQRKAALYRANKNKFSSRPSERTQRDGPHLPLVIKGDVDGSVDTLLGVLSGYDAQQQCALEVVHFGIGDVSENDVETAAVFAGSVYGFNVAAAPPVRQLAARLGVELRLHSVIYKMIDQLKDELSSRLPPATQERLVGEAAVLSVFHVSVGKKKVPVAGCRVQKGSLSTLKHHRDEVPVVKLGVECGVSAEGAVDFRAGDVIVCFEELEVAQVTSWDPGF
ncbi:Translation initiation factor IF-2, mitochondrial [Liparis tanakae]|uniref:Translation initiation factor IF-2, mitochondrial n=1 Tax=Liparis tanakae TaxID=230148 RepID=A0A4Z2EMM7_9TELE|nr:Translation initiation factor IF-2, mitochondrial [Liparis tanakae]